MIHLESQLPQAEEKKVLVMDDSFDQVVVHSSLFQVAWGSGTSMYDFR